MASADKTADKMGLWTQLKGFNRIFWTGNSMEMLERLAYYGLRAVVALYIVEAVENGGPQFSQADKGLIFAWWAAIQSFVPIFTGGFADKYGYKLTVAISVAIKIIGYLVMAYAIELAAMTTGGASTGVPGHATVFGWFMLGAALLALGTAVFKPGLQGIIALQLKTENASVGWSVFYQIVNVGGFLGPYLAGAMRLMAWRYVFIACAAIVALNWIVLFTFAEPTKETLSDALDEAETRRGALGVLKLLWDSLIGICEPRLMAFLVVFSGFWAMFHQLFDLLPNYIDDWVDSSMIADQVAAPLFGIFGSELPAAWHGLVPPEQLINLNAGMCMTLAFMIGYLTGKVRSMTAMISGILVAAAAIYGIGLSTNGWWILGCIATFSLGELMSSPTKIRYFSNIAPPGKKGLYLGYVNATGGIGWALGSIIAGTMYEQEGDKVVLARRYLIEQLHEPSTNITALPKTEVMPRLAEVSSQSVLDAQRMLFDFYDPTGVWTRFALIGLVSMFGLIFFDWLTRKNLKWEAYILTALTLGIAWYTYGWKWGLAFGVAILIYDTIQRVRPEWLPQGQGSEEEPSIESNP